MRRVRQTVLLIAGLWLVFALAGCQASTGGDSSAPVASLTASPEGGDYWGLVEQAQRAYAEGRFAEAMSLARQAVTLNPEDNTAWELYTQATIASAGDTYLRELPDHRYRLPVEVFIRDRVNHTRDWFIIDVREPDEFAQGHIEGAVNIPLHELLQHLDEIPTSKSAPILLYCHSQKRATHALVILRELGYLKVFNLEGGFAAYEEWISSNALPTPGPTPTPGPEEPDFGC